MRQSVARSQNPLANGVNGVAPTLAARIENPPDCRHECRTERILDQRRRDERRDADQPRLFDAEFHAERKPTESRGENQDVSERHRDEQPEHRPVPAALTQPARHEGRRHEAEEIAGGRTDQRRKAAGGACEDRNSNGSLGQIGDCLLYTSDAADE